MSYWLELGTISTKEVKEGIEVSIMPCTFRLEEIDAFMPTTIENSILTYHSSEDETLPVSKEVICSLPLDTECIVVSTKGREFVFLCSYDQMREIIKQTKSFIVLELSSN